MARCKGCGADDDLRLGYCWECATHGEARASRRSVWLHFCHGVYHLSRGWRWEAMCDFRWAWQRLTGTGVYAPGGSFDGKDGDG